MAPSSELHMADLRARVEAIPAWYHTFELPDGIVTNAYYDHRKVIPKLPIPQSLEGKRCLDLASSDGLFAFEMARRGGEVVSLDLDDQKAEDWQGADSSGTIRPEWYAGAAGTSLERFEIARAALGLDVERVSMNIYDASPDSLGGKFDFVFMGNILLHLSDPGRALRAARSVTEGQFLSFETISLTLTLLRPRTPCAQLYPGGDARWWTANVAGHRRLVRGAGFDIERAGFPMMQPFGAALKAFPPPPLRGGYHRLGSALAYRLFNRPFGVPSAWALCR